MDRFQLRMNQEKFDEQLKKYKVVRNADYYRPRAHRPKVSARAARSRADVLDYCEVGHYSTPINQLILFFLVKSTLYVIFVPVAN